MKKLFIALVTSFGIALTAGCGSSTDEASSLVDTPVALHSAVGYNDW